MPIEKSVNENCQKIKRLNLKLSNALANNNNAITFEETLVDAFGRLKVSNPITLLEKKICNNALPYTMSTLTENSGSITFNQSDPGYLTMNVVSDGDKVVRQSRLYTTYQAGKGLEIFVTGTLNASTSNFANTISRIGYFDDVNDKNATYETNRNGNGFFFELNNGKLYVVERTSIGGIQTDNKIAQKDWNIDPLDGTGPSCITIDPTKRQIFFIQLEWLGVGNVMMGVVISGNLIFVHEFEHANKNSIYPYTNTATLPIRYELESTGGSAEMVEICATVISNGGYNPKGTVFTKAMIEIRTSTSMVEEGVFALRLQSDFRRSLIKLANINFNIVPFSGANLLFRVYRFFDSDTAIIGGTWTSLPNSVAEYQIATASSDVSFMIPSTNLLIVEDYVSNTINLNISNLSDLLSTIITSNIEGISDIILVTVTPLVSGMQIGQYAVSLQWEELN